MMMSKTCERCGSAVSDQFARVFGNNESKVFRCMNCVVLEEGGRSALRNGGAAVRNMEEINDRI